MKSMPSSLATRQTHRHCEERSGRSNPFLLCAHGLFRFARNDDGYHGGLISVVIASKAKQSMGAKQEWIASAAPLLAMTVRLSGSQRARHGFHLSPRDLPQAHSRNDNE